MNKTKVKQNKYKDYIRHKEKMSAGLNYIEDGLSIIKKFYTKPGFKDTFMLKNLTTDQLIGFYGDTRQIGIWLEDIKHQIIQAIAISEIVEELLKEEDNKN